MLQFYKSSPNSGDQWRVMGYNKAISALKNHPKEITTWEVCIKMHCMANYDYADSACVYKYVCVRTPFFH